MTFDEIMTRWAWKPIRHCPGRWILSTAEFCGEPASMVGPGARVVVFEVEAAADPVVVVRLDRGGLICYKKGDGRYLHTLNSVEGFARKLSQLRVSDLD